MDIPGYTIIRELGRGGMATVYLARQDRLGRHVALKVMSPPSPASEEFASRFIKEGRIIAQLQHPNIITIFDFDILGDLHYFSMEYLPNGALSDAIAEGMTESKALSIARGIAQALTVAHDNGVIHRDIKPQNILFRTDGTPVLTDFGIARAAGAGMDQTQLTSVGMIIGSPRYMSPEQTMGKPIDARTDLYSLGVVLYEMLTRELPYQAEDVFSLAMKHCSAPIPDLPQSLNKFQPLIDKLLAKNSQDRLGSATELIRELDAYQTGQQPIPILESADATRIVAPEVSSSLAAAARNRTSGEFSRPIPSSKETSRLLKLSALYLSIALIILAAGGIGWHLWQNVALPYSALIAQLPAPEKNRSDEIAEMEKRAIGFLHESNFNQSLRAVDAALQFAPDDSRILALRDLILNIEASEDLLKNAENSLQKGLYDDGLVLVERGLELIPEQKNLLKVKRKLEQAITQRAAREAENLLNQAKLAFEQERYAESLRILKDGLAIFPDNQAMSTLKREVEQQINTIANLQSLIEEATKLATEGLNAQSLEVLDKALTIDPENSRLLDLKSTVTRQLDRENTEIANDLAKQAETLAAAGHFSQALSLIDQAIVKSSDEAQSSQFERLREQIRGNQASAQVADLLENARAALKKNAPQQALDHLAAVEALEPDNAEIVPFRAIAEAQKKDLAAIEKHLAAARVQLEQNNPSAAFAILDQGIKDFPDSDAISSLRALTMAEMAKSNTQRRDVFFEQATRLADADDFDASLAFIEKGLEVAPSNPDLLSLKEAVLERKNQQSGKDDRVARCDQLLDSHAPNDGLSAYFASLGAAADCYVAAFASEDQTQPLKEKLNHIVEQLKQHLHKESDIADIASGIAVARKLSDALPTTPAFQSLVKGIARDIDLFPEMVSLSGDCFMMGATSVSQPSEPDEAPRRICFDSFSLGSREVTYRHFAQFVDATEYQTDAERGTGEVLGCFSFDDHADNPWSYHPWSSWRQPIKHLTIEPEHPVACVSQHDAKNYSIWLSKLIGEPLRLPTEAEWEFAARAGTDASTFWGENDASAACRFANVADTGNDWDDGFGCDDNYEWIAPVGHFKPNPWGFYDMLGNVAEWTCSEYTNTYGNGENKCAEKRSNNPVALRGGAWNTGPATLRTSFRNRNFPESRYSFVGFRLAGPEMPEADLQPQPTVSSQE